jgi:hypothetical protein
MPFIEYLNAVDEILETHGFSSKQEELADIADAQEAGFSPTKCAEILKQGRAK